LLINETLSHVNDKLLNIIKSVLVSGFILCYIKFEIYNNKGTKDG